MTESEGENRDVAIARRSFLDVYTGPNTKQVAWVAERMASLSPMAWLALTVVDTPDNRDELEVVLATLMERVPAARQWWGTVKQAARPIADAAAIRYAASTDEAPRTLEHTASAMAWDGAREKVVTELLVPAQQGRFRVTTEYSLGAVMVRPYGSPLGFLRLWGAREDAIGLIAAETDGTAPGPAALLRDARQAVPAHTSSPRPRPYADQTDGS